MWNCCEQKNPPESYLLVEMSVKPVVVVGGSNHCIPDLLITPYGQHIPAGCVCERGVFIVSLFFPESNSDPHVDQNSNKIPLSCRVTRWTSVIVATGLSSIHPSVMSVRASQTEQKKENKNRRKRNSHLVVKLLFTRCGLGHEEQKCGSLVNKLLNICDAKC